MKVRLLNIIINRDRRLLIIENCVVRIWDWKENEHVGVVTRNPTRPRLLYLDVYSSCYEFSKINAFIGK